MTYLTEFWMKTRNDISPNISSRAQVIFGFYVFLPYLRWWPYSAGQREISYIFTLNISTNLKSKINRKAIFVQFVLSQAIIFDNAHTLSESPWKHLRCEEIFYFVIYLGSLVTLVTFKNNSITSSMFYFYKKCTKLSRFSMRQFLKFYSS